ncbi:MAG: hypothetical protein K0Q73_5223 [Paenibacillus sp.]|jgi:hypothetical protein|nr:hypothetical protein [Paenibacillus sp.]
MINDIWGMIDKSMNGKKKHRKFELDKVIVSFVFKKKKKHRKNH